MSNAQAEEFLESWRDAQLSNLTPQELVFLSIMQQEVDKYLQSCKGKTTPHINDFLMVMQQRYERARQR